MDLDKYINEDGYIDLTREPKPTDEEIAELLKQPRNYFTGTRLPDGGMVVIENWSQEVARRIAWHVLRLESMLPPDDADAVPSVDDDAVEP